MTVSSTSPPAALAALGAFVATLLVACAAPPKTVERGELPFDQAVAQASDAIAAQAQTAPAFLAKLAKKSIVLDPMLDAATGQQTAAKTLLETRVGTGMGFRQNIVGSGTDNAVDALDRRVEFKIVPCT